MKYVEYIISLSVISGALHYLYIVTIRKGWGYGDVLVYKYSVGFSWFKKICCRRVDYCATWLTAGWYVGELSGSNFRRTEYTGQKLPGVHMETDYPNVIWH